MSCTIKNIKLFGDRVYLRILTPNDVDENYVNWLNDPEVTKYLETKSATLEALKKYVEEKYNSTSCLFFGIYDKSNDFHIGNVKLEPIDFEKKSAILGTLIGEKSYWGKGIAKEVYRILLKYYFNELNMEVVEAGIYDDAIGAIKAVQSVGFKKVKEFGKYSRYRLIKSEFIS